MLCINWGGDTSNIRLTFVSFSKGESRSIREQLSARSGCGDCPICGEPLEVEGLAPAGTLGSTFHVTYVPCRHTALITEVRDERQLELGV